MKKIKLKNIYKFNLISSLIDQDSLILFLAIDNKIYFRYESKQNLLPFNTITRTNMC